MTRNLFSVVLCIAGVSLAVFSLGARPNKAKMPRSGPPVSASLPTSASPTGATLTSANIGPNNAINYSDSTGSLVPNLTFFAGQGTCAVPMSCSTFTLTIDPSVGTPSGSYDPTKYNVFIEVSWATPAEDYDTWMCAGSGNCTQANVVASNASTADPETITLPTTTAAGTYTINLVNTSGAAEPYNGTIYLKQIPQQTNCTGNCTPPRYMNYPAGAGQSDDAGEPSIGVDWNPNVASLKNGPNPPTGGPPLGNKINLNTGGVAFFKSGGHNWRVNFDDCPSPAVNLWEDVSTTFDTQFVLTDPIGFVDHYTNDPTHVGQVYPEPHTPGRVFTIDLVGGEGNSLGAYSDMDGNGTYTPGGNGGPGQGPDHETLGGGPYNPNAVPPPPPQPIAYPATGTPNAIYYCSQNIVAEAQCSRSDDGGQTFGPGVIIYNPTVCTGGIHGHVKVAPDGTVYVPNSSCGSGGTSGVAVSTDNGLTWTEHNVPGSTSTQDPSVGIGQNNVGLPLGQTTNTIYFGYVDGDGHAKVAHSGDRGGTWSTPVDVGTPFGVTHSVFPVVVAGDDNRAAFAFLGTGPAILAPGMTGTCDPYGATTNCANIWHLYIATTYDGGANWVTIDATPNDPVQKGVVCLQGTTCLAGRNLLDFNDFAIDAEGRGLVGYADGCVNCNNSFDAQSGASHGTVARQSGGRRLFAHFDPTEPAVPAAPQLVSAANQSPSGALITWIEPDNGGLPITGYKVYRGTTSGGETFLVNVSGETTTSYLDPSPPSGNVYYFVTAVNAHGESAHCGELLLANGPPLESECLVPGLTKILDSGDPCQGTAPAGSCGPGENLARVQIAQPYQTDNVPRLIFTITTDPGMSPQPAGTAWFVSMETPGGGHKAVHMAWYPQSAPNPTFESYTPAPNNSGGVDGRFVTAGSQKPAEASSSYVTPFNKIIIVVKASDLGLNPGDVISGFNSGVTVTSDPAQIGLPALTATLDELPAGLGYVGSYTVESNQQCRPNLPPVAVLTANPVTGPPGTVVHFDGSGSYDPDTAPPADTIVNYHFDFGDGSSADCPGNAACTGTGKIDHTYNDAGDYPARLVVTESRGG